MALAFVYPGQGAQGIGMGADFRQIEAFERFQPVVSSVVQTAVCHGLSFRLQIGVAAQAVFVEFQQTAGLYLV